MKTVKEAFPIWKVEDNTIINKNLDISRSYKLELPEVFTLSGDDYKQINDLILKGIRILQPGVMLHKQDWFFKQQSEDPYKLESVLSNANRNYFSERELVSNVCFLTFTLKHEQSKKRGYSIAGKKMSANKGKKGKENSSVETKHSHAKFINQVDQFVALLNTSKWFSLTLLTEKDLYDIKGYGSGIYQDYLNLEHNSSTVSDIEFSPGFKVGNKYVNMYSLSSIDHYPDFMLQYEQDKQYSVETASVYKSWSNGLGLWVGLDHIINQYIEVVDAKKLYKQLEQKGKRLKSFSLYGSGNKIRRDEILSFLNDCHTNSHLPVKVHLNMIVWSANKELLDSEHLEITSAFQNMGCKPRIVGLEKSFLFFAGVLGNGSMLPDQEKVTLRDKQATALFYLEGSTKSDIGYHGIKLNNRVNGAPLLLDLSEAPMKKGDIKNRNKVFVGDSGGGKSFFMNHLLRHYAEQGAHILIVDIGHSYRRLCEMNNGLYYTYSEDMSINPFWVSLDEKMSVEKKESLLTLLFTLWKQKPTDKSPAEYSLLSEALTGYYDEVQKKYDNGDKGIMPVFNDFYEYIDQVFKPKLDKDNLNSSEYFNITDFQICLKKFYKGGEYDNLLNAKHSVNLRDQSFIVFELDSIADHPILFPIVALIIMETFISKMRSLQGVKKVIVIEEAWKAIAKEGFDSFIKYLYKTCRKFYGEPIVVTQEIEDLLESEVVKNTIIKQSDTLFVADLGRNVPYINQLQQILGFSEHEKALVLSLNKNNHGDRKYKEIFIRMADSSNVYAVEVSPTEYACYTTEEKETKHINTLNEKYNDLEFALRSFSLDKD